MRNLWKTSEGRAGLVLISAGFFLMIAGSLAYMFKAPAADAAPLIADVDEPSSPAVASAADFKDAAASNATSPLPLAPTVEGKKLVLAAEPERKDGEADFAAAGRSLGRATRGR